VAKVPWRFPIDLAFRNPQPAKGKMGNKRRFKNWGILSMARLPEFSRYYSLIKGLGKAVI
jgi:hypothetical protein